MLKIFPAQTDKDLEITKELFVEYAESLEFNLCFQNFEQELADLPGEYSQPYGCILLAEYEGKTAGCVAVRKLKDRVCEMKRLYVKPQFRNLKIGKALTKEIIRRAKAMDYERMWLDFVAPRPAEALYLSLGFREIEPYEDIPFGGVVFMELKMV
jgi:GNAT superfamily N-acetyltransferase